MISTTDNAAREALRARFRFEFGDAAGDEYFTTGLTLRAARGAHGARGLSWRPSVGDFEQSCTSPIRALSNAFTHSAVGGPVVAAPAKLTAPSRTEPVGSDEWRRYLTWMFGAERGARYIQRQLTPAQALDAAVEEVSPARAKAAEALAPAAAPAQKGLASRMSFTKGFDAMGEFKKQRAAGKPGRVTLALQREEAQQMAARGR